MAMSRSKIVEFHEYMLDYEKICIQSLLNFINESKFIGRINRQQWNKIINFIPANKTLRFLSFISSMENSEFNIKRSYSECLNQSSQIYCPSPSRASRISLNVAREVFDFSSSSDEGENIMRSISASSLTKVKFFSLQTDTDSTRYNIV